MSREDQLRKRILIAGLGSQGWAIVRQLLKLDGDHPQYQLYVYDPNEDRVRTLVPDVAPTRETADSPVGRALQEGRLHRLRVPDAHDSAQLRRAILDLEPHLIINASIEHELYTEVALAADCDYIDLGHGTWPALRKRALDQQIRETGGRLRYVPECGLGPGLINILGAWLLRFGGDSLQLRTGGLPMDTHKGDGLHYGISWSVAGLIQGYVDVTVARQNGRTISLSGLTSLRDREEPGTSRGVDPFPVSKPELVARLKSHMGEDYFARDEDGGWTIRNLEARPTSEGISLMPFDANFANLGQVEFKTLRYYPHFDLIERWQAAGILEQELGQRRESGIPDLILLRVWAEEAGSVRSRVQGLVLCDRELEEQGGLRDAEHGAPLFTAMEHLTGWPTCLAARALLDDRDAERRERPDLIRGDHLLWSGRSLDAVLREGGVIMPYELVDGERILAELDSDRLIPHREFQVWT